MDLITIVQGLVQKQDQLDLLTRGPLIVWEKEPAVIARINIALLPRETPEMKRFRVEEFPGEIRQIANYPAIITAEMRKEINQISNRLHWNERQDYRNYPADLSPRDHCERRYRHQMSDFEDHRESVDSAINEIQLIGRPGAVGMRSFISSLTRKMYGLLVKPYLHSLQREHEQIIEQLGITIDALGFGWSDTLLVEMPLPYPTDYAEPGIIKIQQQLGSSNALNGFIDRFVDSFQEGIYCVYHENGYFKVEFKDLPHNQGIKEVQMRIAPVSWIEAGDPQVLTKEFLPHDCQPIPFNNEFYRQRRARYKIMMEP